MRVFGVCAVAASIIATAVGMALSNDRAGLGPNEAQPVLLDRPEVRALGCPSNGAMVWRTTAWEMEIGPVVMQFAGSAVNANDAILAANRRGWLVQKIPLRIDAPPGTPFSVHRYAAASGAEMVWEGTSALPPPGWPVAERHFAPGQMAFPESGCYQLFVEVDGVGYGPFGFVVAQTQGG